MSAVPPGEGAPDGTKRRRNIALLLVLLAAVVLFYFVAVARMGQG